MFFLSKNKLHWNQKTKNNVILSVGNVHCVQRCMHALFSSCLMQSDEEFLCHGNGSPDEIFSICLVQENQEVYPWTHSGKLSKKEMPDSVWQWTLVKKGILALRLFEDNWRTGASRLQHDVTCVCSCIVTAMYVFMNPIELYWIATINKYFNMVCLTFRSPCISWQTAHYAIRSFVLCCTFFVAVCFNIFEIWYCKFSCFGLWVGESG
jgi:hypothetical protein